MVPACSREYDNLLIIIVPRQWDTTLQTQRYYTHLVEYSDNRHISQ